MGIFYNALLDGRFSLSSKDWIKRQEIAVKTISMDLDLLSQSKKVFTTFMKIYTVFAGVNIYTEPSDSLFAILYSLYAMIDENFILKIYPSTFQKKKNTLQTKKIASFLLKKYKNLLQILVQNYAIQNLNKGTFLVREDICLASARDGMKRQSAFYDNVIATLQFAVNLGLRSKNIDYFEKWKRKIIKTFWDEEEGIFIDDLSEESKTRKIFCADSFIVLGSTFFIIRDKEDMKKLKKMISYVKRNKLDKPFPLHYALYDQPQKLYWPVRIFAQSYMGESIWSHWGMEYIKALILLSSGHKEFLNDAERHLNAYKRNIVKYGGYPFMIRMAIYLKHCFIKVYFIQVGW